MWRYNQVSHVCLYANCQGLYLLCVIFTYIFCHLLDFSYVYHLLGLFISFITCFNYVVLGYKSTLDFLLYYLDSLILLNTFIIAWLQVQVQHDHYFQSFPYFANLFDKPLGKINNYKIMRSRILGIMYEVNKWLFICEKGKQKNIKSKILFWLINV